MNTAGRRRKQAIAGYPNIRPNRRPRFAASRKAAAKALNPATA